MYILRSIFAGIGLFLATFSCCNAEVNSKENDKFIFKRALAGKPESLDVHRTIGAYEQQLIEDLFTPLLQYSLDGKVEAGVAIKWDISKDGKVYTFYLRDSKWSNGDPVTAEDFVYAFRRAIDPKHGYIKNNVVQPFANADKIISGQEKDVTKLGVRAIDQTTLEITLEEPIPHFLELLAFNAFPVHRENIEKYGDAWTTPGKMVNNGPFNLSKWIDNGYIELTKNELFYDANEVKLNKVRYEIIQDIVLQVHKFRTGELDVTNQLGPEHYVLAKQMVPENILKEFTLGTTFLMIQKKEKINKKGKDKNQILEDNKKTLKNPNIIKALGLAIDREALINLAMNGLRKPAFGIVPEGVNNYEVPSIEPELPDQKAREKLAQEIYKREMGDKTLNINILYPMKPDRQRMLQVIASMWKKVLNIDVNLEVRDWSVWLSEIHAHNFEMSLNNWGVESNDPYTALSMFLTDDVNNVIAYSNSHYDSLFKEANIILDLKERAKKLREAELLLLKDGVVIPLSYNGHAILIKKNVKGWSTNRLYKRPSWRVYKE